MLDRLSGGHNPKFNEEEMTDTEFELNERLELIEERLEQANKAFMVQGELGNWNANPYMLGMYNGMEFVFATLEGREPVYREFSAFSAEEPAPDDVSDIEVDENFVNRCDNNDDGVFDGNPDDVIDLDGIDLGVNIYPDDESVIEGSITGGSDDIESDDSYVDAGDIDVDPDFLN